MPGLGGRSCQSGRRRQHGFVVGASGENLGGIVRRNADTRSGKIRPVQKIEDFGAKLQLPILSQLFQRGVLPTDFMILKSDFFVERFPYTALLA